MRIPPQLVLRVVRQLMVAAALTTLAATEVRAQSGVGVIESWRDSAGNWTGKRHALDSTGNLLVVGDTVVGDIIQVRKYSPTGQLLWSRIYDPLERVVSYWIATDLVGNAWIAAARITGSQNSPVGFLVLKYDPQGNLLFVDVTNGGRAVRVLTDTAGNGYVIGNGWFAGTLADHYMVVKYAPDGRRLWSGFLENGSSTYLAGPRSLALSPDESRLVIAGGGFSSTWHALSVAMYDTATGQRLWNYVDTSKYGAQDVAFSPDGASVLVGNTEIGLTNAMALHKFDLSGNRRFSRIYTQGIALVRLSVDSLGNVVAIGTAAPLPGSGYRDWMTIKTDAAGALLWARRYDATFANDEVPEWVSVDSADAVYVAGMGGPGPSTGNVSFLKPVTLKYNSAGTPIWVTFVGGNAQVTVDDLGGGRVFTLAAGQMTSARFEQTGVSDAAPASPTQLTAAGSFNGVEFRIDLAWTDNATNELYYAIERCAGAGCSNFVEIRRALGENATGFRDAPLSAGATYTYRVRAIGFTSNSGYSNPITATTSIADSPAAPSNLAATSSAGAVRLSWTDNSADESQFAIERCAGAGCTAFTQVSAVGTNVTTYLDTAVVGGQSYSYRVRAAKSSTYSSYSNVASVTTPVALPAAPTNLAASSRTRRRINLTWINSATDATAITVQRCTGSACTTFVDVVQLAATATAWTDSGLKSGSTYRYRVYASNTAGSSAYSNIASATAR